MRKRCQKKNNNNNRKSQFDNLFYNINILKCKCKLLNINNIWVHLINS